METTPRSSGIKGWGPSWAKKDAKPRKPCLSVSSAESVKGNERERGPDTETLSFFQQPQTPIKFRFLTA